MPPMPSVTRALRTSGCLPMMPLTISAISADVRSRVLLVPMLRFIEIRWVPLLCMEANVLSESACPKVPLMICASGTAASISS